jgi:N-acyl-D-amino-acid deacylase
MVQALLDHLQGTGFEDFDYCRIAHAPNNPDLAGKTLAQVTAARREVNDARAQAEVIIDLYVESKGQRVGMVYHKMADQDVETIMQAPFVGVASDAGIRVPGAARPHPRGSGNNPRVLGHFVRERKTIGLAEAVRKMTSLPADVFGLKDRGRLVEGCLADIVVFDPEKIVDRATYAEPYDPPSGLTWVLVNGAPVVEDGEHRGLRAGRVLRHRQPPLPSPR